MRWIIATTLLLAACGEDFAPIEGDWTRTLGDVTEDTCGINDDGDTDVDDTATLVLTNNEDGTITAVAEDDDITWTCTLTEMDFDCGSQIMEERDFSEDPGLDAVLTSTASVTGSFSAEDAMSGQTHVEITCAGTECDTVAENADMDLPCSMTQAWTATADSAE